MRVLALLLFICAAATTSLGLAQQQLRAGDTIQVVSGPLNVRDAPGLSGSAIGQVIQGQLASIVDGAPYWADGYWWWSILADDGTAGWVAEGDASLDYIGLAESSPGPQSLVGTVAQAAEPETEARPAATAVSMPGNAAVDTSSSTETSVDPPESAASEAPTPEPEPDPYVHLPAPVRLEREHIDAELDGLWVSMAIYGPGPGRGGPAFSWGYQPDGSSGSIPYYYWCESDLLTAGAPFFERIDSNASSPRSFQTNSLSVADLQVSCTDSRGLKIEADSLDRVLAFLRAPWPYPHDRAVSPHVDVLIAAAHSLTLGTVEWLEVRVQEQNAEQAATLECHAEPSNNIVSRPESQRPIRCERIQESSSLHETLTIDAEQGSITWEFSHVE